MGVSKPIVFLATLFTLLSSFTAAAAATPPACLLAAIGAQENPADLEAICGESLSEVQEAIQSACSGDELEAAEDAFSGTCAESGTTISGMSMSESKTGNDTAAMTYTTMTFDPECSCNKTAVMSSTGVHNGTVMSPTPTSSTDVDGEDANNDDGEDSVAGGSGTGPAFPESTGGATKYGLGSLAMAAIAVAGFVAVL